MTTYFVTGNYTVTVDSAVTERAAELVALQRITEADFGELDNVEWNIINIDFNHSDGFEVLFNVSGYFHVDLDGDEPESSNDDEVSEADFKDLCNVQWEVVE